MPLGQPLPVVQARLEDPAQLGRAALARPGVAEPPDLSNYSYSRRIGMIQEAFCTARIMLLDR